MDKLIAAEEFFFDSPAASTTTTTAENVDFEVNADKYRNFLRINPIWSYLGLSKEEYFKLSVQERTSNIHRYYINICWTVRFVFFNFFLLILV